MTTSSYQALFEAAPDAMVVVDDALHVVHLNDQAERLFGRPRHELLDTLVDRILPSWPIVTAGSGTAPTVARRADGELVAVSARVRFVATAEGSRCLATLCDTASRALADETFLHLLEAAPDATVIADSTGTIHLVNARTEAIFGYTRDQMIGHPFEMLIPERFRNAHRIAIQGYFQAPRQRPMGHGLTFPSTRRDGTEFPAEISLSPFKTTTMTFVIASVRDVSHRRRVEEDRAHLRQAQEAIQVRDNFIAVASHELHTPITALRMQVDSMARLIARAEPEALVRVAGRLDSVRTSLRQLSALVDQLLDVSHLTEKRLVVALSDLDLTSLVRRVVDTMTEELDAAGCEVRVNAEEHVHALADPLRVEQILVNLLSNAMKYGRSRPVEVTITRTSEGAPSFSVRDHGIGIASDQHARIFERFERLDAARSYRGFGLGLWIVRQLVDAHKGAIRVQSEEGAGALFEVTLPAPTVRYAMRPGEATKPVDILFVDDDTAIREAFRDALLDEAYTVETATDGRDALTQLREGLCPKLVLLDLNMPVMDGSAFCHELRKDAALAALPVVILSAAADAADQAAALGAVGSFRKPVVLEQLLGFLTSYAPRPQLRAPAPHDPRSNGRA